MRVVTTADGYLVVNESYHRGWRAKVDGASAPVYLADFLFLAVPCPAASTRSTSNSRALSLSLGAAVSLVALLVWAHLMLAGVTLPRLGRPQRPANSLAAESAT